MDTEVKKRTPDAAWKATLGELGLQMTRATFDTWLKDAVLISAEEQVYRIGVRNTYAKDWLENRLNDTIQRTLAAITEQSVSLEYIVLDSLPVQLHPHLDEARQPVEERQHKNGVSSTSNRARRKKVDDGRRPPSQPPDDVNTPIRYRNIRPPTDPLGGFVKLTHYANRFWRPYLGQQTFALLEIISGFSYEIKTLHKPGPSLKLLAELLQCDPHDLAGRNGSGDQGKGTYRPGKYGYLNELRDHHICHHHTEGRGRGQVQYFDYLTEVDNLPLLTPKQVEKLAPFLQDIHWEWLKLHTAVVLDEWLADERETAVLLLPLGEFLGR